MPEVRPQGRAGRVGASTIARYVAMFERIVQELHYWLIELAWLLIIGLFVLVPVLVLMSARAEASSESYVIVSTGRADIKIEDRARALFGHTLTHVDTRMQALRLGMGKRVTDATDFEVSGRYFGSLTASGQDSAATCYSDYCASARFDGGVTGDILGVQLGLVSRLRFGAADVHFNTGVMYAKASVTARAVAAVNEHSVEIRDVSLVRSGFVPLYGVGVSYRGLTIDILQATDKFTVTELGYKFTW